MQSANSGARSGNSASFPYESETYQSRFSGQIGVLFGLCILAIIAVAFASLATWSVDDPSFSNATSRMVENAGGYWGASFADILIQFTGLASIIAIVPPAIWGWLKLIQKPIGMLRKRIIVWPLAVIVSAAAFACLPLSEGWPLPSGLGGIFGDLILKLPTWLLGGYPSGFWAALFFTILLIPSIILTLFASGIISRNIKFEKEAFVVDPETGEVFEDEPSSGLLLGAMGHFWLTTKMLFKRQMKHTSSIAAKLPSGRNAGAGMEPEFEGESSHDPANNSPVQGVISRVKGAWNALTMPPDDGFEAFETEARAEPEFGNIQRNVDSEFITAPEMAPSYGEEVFSSDDHYERSSQDSGQGIAMPSYSNPQSEPTSPRVLERAPQPKQSNRVVREAQPSLLENNDFELPHLNFLGEAKNIVQDKSLSAEALEANARLLEGVLEDFGVKGEIIKVHPGPVVTLYELEPAPGIKSSRVIGLADDIARSMSAIACRVAVVPGRNAIGIELPNSSRETVYLREVLESQDYEKTKQKLALVLGKTIGGEPVIADLAKMPHLLVAGTTGSGKSVAINTMILSILYRLSPKQVKMIMIDPKMLELSIYDGIPHLLTPVVTDPKKAVVALKWTVREMEDRYKKMSKLGVRNIDGYNQRLEQARKKGEVLTRTVQTGYDQATGEAIFETEDLKLEAMPYIVVIIDEMADLMMVAGKDIEGAIQRLAQMARAAGIHVVMATQRPSVDVITGTIKANFPTRISFQVTSKIDSRTILGEQGAEQLLGMGDMLFMAGGGRIQRVHGPFVADEEVEMIVNHLKTQGVPQYLEAVTQDDEEEAEGGAGSAGLDALSESNDIYDQAVSVVLRDRKVSTSYIQRRLGIGYNRAATLIERMEQEGLIGAANHAGKREILVPDENETI
ncbi:MAG: DNA translocase FtsK [Salaquimonas sp.]